MIGLLIVGDVAYGCFDVDVVDRYALYAWTFCFLVKDFVGVFWIVVLVLDDFR